MYLLLDRTTHDQALLADTSGRHTTPFALRNFLRRKNKRFACNLLRCVTGTIRETFCKTNSDLWAPYVVTLHELVLLLWEIEQADDPELLDEISTRKAM